MEGYGRIRLGTVGRRIMQGTNGKVIAGEMEGFDQLQTEGEIDQVLLEVKDKEMDRAKLS